MDRPERDIETDGRATAPRPWTRRRVLTGTGAVGLGLLAGCSGGGSDGSDGGGSDGDDGSGGDGGDGGNGDGSGGDGGDGSDGDSADGPGRVGQLLTGDLVSAMVEYVRPVETVVDHGRVPFRREEASYGQPRTVDYYVERGLAKEGDSLYALGLALKNTYARPVTVLAYRLLNADGALALGGIPSESQRLTLNAGSRVTGTVLAPGEVRRGEVVFALPSGPEEFLLPLDVFSVGFEADDRFDIDLGAGSEGRADFGQEPATASVGETTTVGDFEVTLHTVEFVDSLEESRYQDIYGPREGYRYLRLDLSATRNSDVTIGQEWSLGVFDDEGYEFEWGGSYQDALDLERTTLDRLDVGESIEHTVLAFPIEDGFDPTYLAMNAPGPFADASETLDDDGMNRRIWSLA